MRNLAAHRMTTQDPEEPHLQEAPPEDLPYVEIEGEFEGPACQHVRTLSFSEDDSCYCQDCGKTY